MGKQIIIGVLLVAAGLGGGFGIGVWVFRPQMDAATAEIEALTATVAAAESASDETLKKAGQQIAAAKAELEQTRTNAIRVGSDLRKADLELQRLKAVLAQVMDNGGQAAPVEPAASAAAAPTARTTPQTSTRPQAAPAVAPEPNRPATGPTRPYTVKDGDSLWKIAANELGNGTRYEEILTLNPTLTKDSKLVIGMTLRLPAN